MSVGSDPPATVEPPTDLVAAARAGDGDAIQQLWRAHRRWVAAVLVTYKPRSVDLEDLLQEVAMTLVTKIHTLREDANLKAWLRTVAVNTARAHGRALKARPLPASGGDDTPEIADPRSTNVTAMQEREQRSRQLLRAAMSLPDTYREPLLLRVMHGMRSKQVAEMLEISPATVDTRVARARRMLREQMENGEPDTNADHHDNGHTIAVPDARPPRRSVTGVKP